jgi:hypothetical protein
MVVVNGHARGDSREVKDPPASSSKDSFLRCPRIRCCSLRINFSV